MVISEFVFNIKFTVKYLQKSDCDLTSALKHVDSVISILQSMHQLASNGTETYLKVC